MPTFNNSLIRFGLTFNLDDSPKTVTFEDFIAAAYNTTYGAVLLNVKGLLKLTDPDGIVFHINANWVARTFGSPDITSAAWTKTTTTCPVDADGKVKEGIYTAEYIVTLNGGTTYFYISKTFDLQYTSPEVVLDVQFDDLLKIVSSVDTTDYTVSEVSPSIVRSHLLTKPFGAGCNAPSAVNNTTTSFGAGNTAQTDAWTGYWTGSLTSTLVYVMELWDTYNLVVVNDVILGSNGVRATADALSSSVIDACHAFYARFNTALSENTIEANKLRDKVIRLTYEWAQFQMAFYNGGDYASHAAIMVEILSSEGYVPVSSSAVSVRIPPLLATMSSVSPSTFNAGWGTGTPTGGNDGDVHFQYDTIPFTSVYLWKKSGSWSRMGQLVGPAGSAATSSSTTWVYIESGLATEDGTLEKVLSTIGQPLDFSVMGDNCKLVAIFQLAANDNGKTCRLYWGGTILAQFDTDKLISAVNNIVKIEANLTYIDNASFFAETTIITNDGIKPSARVVTAPVIGAGQVSATGQNAVSVASAGDITCLQFKVGIEKIIPAL